MAATIEDLERRVSALEGAHNTNTGTLEWLAGEMGKARAAQEHHSARFNQLEERIAKLERELKADIAGLRRDLPSIMLAALQEWDAAKKDGGSR